MSRRPSNNKLVIGLFTLNFMIICSTVNDYKMLITRPKHANIVLDVGVTTKSLNWFVT